MDHTKKENNNECIHSKHRHHGGHQSPGMSHGSAQDFLRRFWIVTFLLIPLLATNDSVLNRFHLESGEVVKWIQFGLATVIFSFALVFFKHAWHEIKSRSYGMMTLVSIAVAAGYGYSAIATFAPALEAEFYLEISSLIWVLLFGHYLEARSSNAAGSALQEVAKLLPQRAHVVSSNGEKDIPVGELEIDDLILVKPGEKIPADGVIIEGSANVDESLISGESKPISKDVDDEVVAGSVCLDGSLTIKTLRVGEHSTVGQIQQLIAKAQHTKPRSQRIADKASAVLTFAAGGVALTTLLAWTLLLGEPFTFAITLAITVLVIACPHALGLAIPTVTTIATQLATKNGLFIKDLSKIEAIRDVDVVVFDKTGTLTSGVFGVSNVISDSLPENDILAIAASLESHSSHVIGQSIVEHAKKQKLSLQKVTNLKNVAGKGIEGGIDGTLYKLGNRDLVGDALIPENLEEKIKELEQESLTLVFLVKDSDVLGLITLADKIKEESRDAVSRIQSMGVKVAMLTGDNEAVAATVAAELGITTYFANVLPDEKYMKIRDLQHSGKSVLMVGDGVNDAPALTQADIGVAIGTGTDIAIEAGDVLLTKDDPRDVGRLIQLSKVVYQKMVQNLIWALSYNLIAIPAAAGVFALWGFFLRPEIGALVMSLSTVIVVINALTLRRVEL